MHYIIFMKNTRFQITQDGSAGLYDNITDDIYHSVTGAYKEAYEKFIFASGFESFVKRNDFVSVLDICYGVGYNSKTAINTAIKINNNIIVNIDALEYNSYVASISPFLKDNISNPDLKFRLIEFLSLQIPDYFEKVREICLNTPDFRSLYSDISICPVIDFIINNHNIRCYDELFGLLHNIYYQNISNSMETSLKSNNCQVFNFNLHLGDARHTIDSCNSLYDFVFLDAFTPSKQPLLWTYQFLSKVKSKMKPSSVLVTYSNSSPVRKTLIDLGFYISKIIIDGKQFGTIAKLSENSLGCPLDNYDSGLLETKSGIPYYDNDTLSLSSDEILNNRLVNMNNSKLMSSTQYIKRVKNESKI